MSGLTPLEEDLLAALDPGEIALHTAGLAAALREPGRDRTTAFIRARLRTWGVPSRIERYDALVSQPGDAYFSLARRDAPVPALTLPYSPATPPDGLVAELRPTTPETASPASIAGAIALVAGPPTSSSVATIAAQGALAQVYIHASGALKPLPVPNPWGGPAATPVILIERETGEGFQALCTAGTTPVRLHVDASWTTRRLTIPIATIKGTAAAEPLVLVGAPAPAADDNGEAAACLLELCRIFASESSRLRRGLRCLWWPGGQPPAASAVWYTDHAWATLSSETAAYLDLTTPRRRSRKRPQVAADPSLQAIVQAALQGEQHRPEWLTLPEPTSATPFARVGVPAVRLATAQATSISTAVPLLARLCTLPLFPTLPTAVTRLLAERIDALSRTAGDRFDLSTLTAQAAALNAAADQGQLALLHLAQGASPNDEEGQEIANRLLQRLNQLLLPVLGHTGDRYGLPPTSSPTPAPGLDALLPYLASDGRDIAATVQLQAAALREGNRLSDALAAATTTINDALAALRPLGYG